MGTQEKFDLVDGLKTQYYSHRIDVDAYGEAHIVRTHQGTGESEALSVDEALEAIAADLARECAESAYDVAPDQCEVADPLEGDWSYLEDQLGKASHCNDVEQAFTRAYRAKLADLLD